MYAEYVCGSGIGWPSSRKPSRWKAIASCMLFSTSARVWPVAMHPGRSGEYAEYPVSVDSTTIKYFFMALVPPASRYCLRSPVRVVARFSSYRDEPHFDRMFELAVTSSRPHVEPAIFLKLSRIVADFHAVTITGSRQTVNRAFPFSILLPTSSSGIVLPQSQIGATAHHGEAKFSTPSIEIVS
jgi:hypothetical protein